MDLTKAYDRNACRLEVQPGASAIELHLATTGGKSLDILFGADDFNAFIADLIGSAVSAARLRTAGKHIPFEADGPYDLSKLGASSATGAAVIRRGTELFLVLRLFDVDLCFHLPEDVSRKAGNALLTAVRDPRYAAHPTEAGSSSANSPRSS